MGRSYEGNDTDLKYSTPRMKHEDQGYEDYETVTKVLFGSASKQIGNSLSLVIPVITRDSLVSISAREIIEQIQLAL